jgi:fucose permease
MNSPRVYLAVYSLGFFCVGLQSNSLGPLIPYLAERRGIPSTEYSSLFLAVTAGVVLGISIYKLLQQQKYTHF